MSNAGSSRENPLAEDLDHVLTHTEGLWEDLRGERVFITGGTGFFGCWLLESFAWANDRLDLGAKTTVLTRDPDAFRRKATHLASHPSVELVTGDVRDFAFPSGTFSHVIHAATESSTRLNDEDPIGMFDAIVDGTRKVLDFSQVAGAERLLLTSSGAVYGKQPLEMSHIPEDYLGGPDQTKLLSAYAEGKRAAEFLCCASAAKTGLHVKIARCFAFVGPYMALDAHFAIGNFIRDALAGGPIVVKGDGTPLRSYLYAADLAVWLWTILFRGESCWPYNVGSEEAVTIAQLATTVARTCRPTSSVTIHGHPDESKPRDRYVPSVRRAATALGLSAWTPLDASIRKTAAAFPAYSSGSLGGLARN